jgi:hypothetical protein
MPPAPALPATEATREHQALDLSFGVLTPDIIDEEED